MRHSEQIGELASALAKAQAAMKGALADSSNPHFKSRYADLESVRSACIPHLAANGVSIVQGIADNKCLTRLVHASGQWIETEVPLIIGKNDMQGVGSAITYARRYGLAAAVCLSQTDDDGNAACEPPRAMHSQQAKEFAKIGHDQKPVPEPKPAPAAKPEVKQPATPPVAPAQKPIDPGLLTDGPILEDMMGQVHTKGTSKQFAAGPYSDDEDSKKWLVRELAFYGVHQKLAHFKTIAAEVHGHCVGQTRPDAQKIIENWAQSKGFKKG